MPKRFLPSGLEQNPTDLAEICGVHSSVMLAVPPALLDILRLQPGAEVGITVESGKLVVEPLRRPRYTLEELLNKCDLTAARGKEDREWLDGKPAGAELL